MDSEQLELEEDSDPSSSAGSDREDVDRSDSGTLTLHRSAPGPSSALAPYSETSPCTPSAFGCTLAERCRADVSPATAVSRLSAKAVKVSVALSGFSNLPQVTTMLNAAVLYRSFWDKLLDCTKLQIDHPNLAQIEVACTSSLHTAGSRNWFSGNTLNKWKAVVVPVFEKAARGTHSALFVRPVSGVTGATTTAEVRRCPSNATDTSS